MFCLVVSILYYFFDLKSKVTEIYRSAGCLYLFFHSFPYCRAWLIRSRCRSMPLSFVQSVPLL
ncbi:hypothetical protein DW701_09105 [Bacteroides eggerthii]|uniref:Uncharacterized protein n=1 Tax=Bacteroides eggerthii TaxID=28111 RepID=A0A414MD48_9BACE|nr:hypothetical protein DWX01_01505 [Bacteroides eggerthii]RHF08996.1 hypothetical protein DW701_09105 [Bacteroides eggerthii]RHH25455.1 hypothetical protein DW218_02735 [Bacteroides eggerthii]